MSFPDAVTYLKACNDKQKEDLKQNLSIAYKLAIWTRCDPKKFPTLEEIYKEIDKAHDKAEGVEQSPNQMFDVVKALHMRFGGK